MSKVLRTAAIVVGAVAAVATAIPTGGGSLGAFGAALAASAGTLQLTAVGLSLAGGLTAKKPNPGTSGSPTTYAADPNALIPYMIGRCMEAASIRFRVLGAAP